MLVNIMTVLRASWLTRSASPMNVTRSPRAHRHCHSADIPSPVLLKHLVKEEGGCSRTIVLAVAAETRFERPGHDHPTAKVVPGIDTSSLMQWKRTATPVLP